MAKIQLKRSVILDGGNAKEPTASQMQYGEIAINYNENDPSIFIKDSSDAIVRIAGVNARGNIPSDIQGYPDITDSQGATLDARYLKLGSGIGAQVVQSSSTTDFNGGLKVSGGSTYLLELASGGATKLVVLPTGQVGIGVTSPTAPLQVSGQVIASSFSGTGSALTSLDGGNISQGTIDTARMPATYTLADNITIKATGASNALDLKSEQHVRVRALNTGSYIKFTGNNGQASYRFTKAGQVTIEGKLDFESLTADRTFTYPNVSGTIALISSTIDNSDKLDGLHAASFIRSDALTEVTSSTEWQDNQKAMFGNDGDLQIYHTGSTAFIDNNTGNLVLSCNVDDDDGGNIVLRAKANEQSIVCNDDGSVKLFFDNDPKLETKAHGSTTTGIHKSDQLESTIANGTSPLIVASSTLVANLNADAVDGVHATSFLRSDVSTTFNANLADFKFNSDGDRILIKFQYNAASKWNLKQNNNGLDLDFENVGTHSGSMRIDGNLIWHAGNDGAGSGLDADTLDGNDSSNFIRSNVASNITNTMEFQDNVELQFGNSSDFRIFHNSSSNNNIIQNYRNSDGNILINGDNTAGITQTMLVADSSTARTFVQLNENDAIRLKTTDIGATVYGSLTTTASQGTAPLIVTSSTVVTNLNADQLDGLHAGSFVRGDGQTFGSGSVDIRADDVDFIVRDLTEPSGSRNYIWRDFSAGLLYLGTTNAVVTPRSNVVPFTDSNFTLGTDTMRWSHCYVDDLTITNGIAGTDITTGTISEDRIPSNIEKQANIEIKANGTGKDLKLYASDHVFVNAGIDEPGVIYFRASNGVSSYRFAKSGQTTIEGYLSFESLTTDRTYTFPDESGTVMLTTYPVDNANKLDGLDSTQFLRSDVAATKTGSTTFNAVVNIRGHLDISDAQEVRFGSSDDFTMSFDANGWLYINQKASGIIFQDNGTNVVRLEDDGTFRPEVTETCTLGGSSKYWANAYIKNVSISSTLNVRGAIDLADNDILRFGTGDDAQMVHDGSHLYLKLLADDDLIITDENSSSLAAVRVDSSARRVYVQDNIYAGYNMAAYNSGSSNAISTYARDAANQAENEWTSYTQIAADWRGKTNESTNESTHHFISAVKDQAGNTAIVHKLDVSGSHWGLGSMYAGRTQSTTTATATNYYGRTGNGYGFHCYNGNPTASGLLYSTNYRAYARLTAVFEDADDRKALYGIKSDTDGTIDYDQDQYLACSAMGRFDVKGGIRSGRVESDEATPNQVYAPVGWGGGIGILSYGGNSNSYTAISGRSTSNSDYVLRVRVNQAADKVRIQSNGQCYTDGAWNNVPADYAEYFEWEDGNVNDEDRRGVTVVLLQDGKIRAATAEDDSESIIGVISAYPAFVGDAAELSWHGMYEKDSFGKPVEENELWLIWNKEYKDGVPINQPIASDPNSWGACEGFPLSDLPRIEKAMADGIQTGIPRWAIDQNCVVNKPKQIVSSAYDPSKVYIPRSERKEWDTVGLIGKLPVVKGSPIGSRWIKMGELSDTLDRYFVR